MVSLNTLSYGNTRIKCYCFSSQILPEFGICKKRHLFLLDWIDKRLIRKDFDGLSAHQINRILIRSENTSRRLIARVAHAFKGMQRQIDLLPDQSMKDRVNTPLFKICHRAASSTQNPDPREASGTNRGERKNSKFQVETVYSASS